MPIFHRPAEGYASFVFTNYRSETQQMWPILGVVVCFSIVFSALKTPKARTVFLGTYYFGVDVGKKTKKR